MSKFDTKQIADQIQQLETVTAMLKDYQRMVELEDSSSIITSASSFIKMIEDHNHMRSPQELVWQERCDGMALPTVGFYWRWYAGMGEDGFTQVNSNENDFLQKLKRDGKLAFGQPWTRINNETGYRETTACVWYKE
jgi:hypothetical protein